MGGVLPVIPQRVLGIGGTAGMVHPSTGTLSNHTMKFLPNALFKTAENDLRVISEGFLRCEI